VSHSLQPVYSWARRWSQIGLLATLIVSALFNLVLDEVSISIQLIIALVALLVGIPHGAIDHLVSIPAKPRSRFFGYIAIYVAIALVAGWAIATWEINGFRIVVLMSALHFGFGDASYFNEARDAQGLSRFSSVLGVIYAIPAGFLPVMLPLTDSRTLNVLERINPEIVNWAGLQSSNFRSAVMILALIAILILTLRGERSMALDLLMLFALSLVAPPLLAFAAYFGFWHALRHTARLVPKLERARTKAKEGNWRGSIWSAVFPGLYAIVGTLVIALILKMRFPSEFSKGTLWSSLVIVWALTVPHMLTTARFDLQALSRKT